MRDQPDIPTIEGCMSLDECRHAIELHAKNINSDVSSFMVNYGRITSLRALLQLFVSYNYLLEEEKRRIYSCRLDMDDKIYNFCEFVRKKGEKEWIKY